MVSAFYESPKDNVVTQTPNRPVSPVYGPLSEELDGLRRLLADLHAFAARVGDDETLADAARLLKTVHEPFSFVVLGEVKAGKSSLVNAILGEDICRAAPDPCTDAVQRIVYSPEPFERRIAEHEKEIGSPSPMLKDLAVVDTPGVNTIIERHQEITLAFLPEADLVLFVFPSLNPYFKSSWDLFDLVKQRRKKTVAFVLSQSDRASATELAVNALRLAELAKDHGEPDPVVFTVSSKRAAENPLDPDMESLRAFIRNTTAGGRSFAAKLDSLVRSGLAALGDVDQTLHERTGRIEREEARAQTVRDTLSKARETADREADALTLAAKALHARMSAELIGEFEELSSTANLVRASFKGLFGKRGALTEAVEASVEAAGMRFEKELRGLVAADPFASTQALLAKALDEAASSGGPGGSEGAKASHFADLKVQVDGLSSSPADPRELSPRGLVSLGDRAVLSGFTAAAGMVLLGTTHAALFDVTGGVLTTVGVFAAAHTLGFKRRGTVKRFAAGLADSGEAFAAAFRAGLSDRLGVLFAGLSTGLSPWFSSLSTRLAEVDSFSIASRALASRFLAVGERVRIASVSPPSQG